MKNNLYFPRSNKAAGSVCRVSRVKQASAEGWKCGKVSRLSTDVKNDSQEKQINELN